MSEYTDDQEVTIDIRGRLTRQREQDIIEQAADDLEQEKLVKAVEIAFDRAMKRLSWFSFKALAWLVFTAVIVFTLKHSGWAPT